MQLPKIIGIHEDPDAASKNNADPDAASKTNGNPCGSGSKTLTVLILRWAACASRRCPLSCPFQILAESKIALIVVTCGKNGALSILPHQQLRLLTKILAHIHGHP
jgi:hypothetical protein